MADIDHKYFPALDGLRAVCITLVIFAHVPNLSGNVLKFVPGWLGVDIFFVISGFLITTLLIREECANLKVDLYAFYIRRFFRIVPLYALVLGFYVFTASTNHQRWMSMRQVLPYYFTFMNDFVASRIDTVGCFGAFREIPFGATWSLGIEEKFYLIWPFLFFSGFRLKKRVWLLPILLFVVAYLPFRMFRSYYGLLLGCCLAIILSSGLLPRTRAVFSNIPITLICLALLGSMWLVQLDTKWVFLFSVLVAVLLCSLVVTDNWLVRLLSLRCMIWVGRRSYSMYLIQAIVLFAVEHIIRPTTMIKQIAVIAFGVAGSAFGSDLLYRFVEEPSRIFGKRLLRRRGEPSSSITPATLSKEDNR